MKDETLIRQRFSRAAGSYEEEATVQRQIAATLVSHLKKDIGPLTPQRILELGCGTGIFSRMLLQAFAPEYLLLNDLCAEMEDKVSDILTERVRFQAGDAEKEVFQGSYNLIASCSALQWFADPQAFFAKAHSLLTPDGILAFTTFGRENLHEITALTGQGLSYLSLQEITLMLADQYQVIYAAEERLTKSFATPMEVLYHLKRTGVTGTTSYRWSKERLSRFCAEYNRQFLSDGLLPLTYHPIYIIAKRK